MLEVIGSNGKLTQIKNVSHQAEYASYKKKVSYEAWTGAWELLCREAEKKPSLSLATSFPKGHPEWEAHGALDPVWQSLKDEKTVSYCLGLMMMDIMIHDDQCWLCTKTNIQKREFAVMYYFRKGRP